MNDAILNELKVMLETALTQLHQHMVSCHNASVASQEPLQTTLPTKTPQTPTMPTNTNVDTLMPWDGPVNNRHNVRVLCDLSGIPLAKTIVVEFADGHKSLYNGKDIITACIEQESGFDNNAKCINHDAHGNITSTDVGLIQVNSHYHCGPGKEFPSTDYVVAHPQEAAQWMIDMYKAGKIDMWVSHSSGAYRAHLPK